MLIPRAQLEGIRDGEVDLAFRRWDRARVRAGTRLRTAVGLVEILAVAEVQPGEITAEDARRAGARSHTELMAFVDRRAERPLMRITLRFAGADPRVALRDRGDLSAAEVAELRATLERMDRTSRHGPWTLAALEAIDRRPATAAAELAASLGRERLPFKRDVRRLKELGLTESLDTGYRLSPRGRALLEIRRTDSSSPAAAGSRAG